MRQRRAPLAIAFVVALFLPAIALAAPYTATYTFTGSPGNQASEPVDANPIGAIFSAITRGPGIAASAGMDSINSSGWTTDDEFDPNDYYEFTITPAENFALDVTDMAFTLRRSGTGPTRFEVRNSLDGFAAAFWHIVLADSTQNFRVDASVEQGFNGSLNLTSPVTFRIYGFEAEAAGGTFRLGVANGEVNDDYPANLTVGGQIDPIPEPATLLLLGAGLTALVRRRRRTVTTALVVALFLPAVAIAAPFTTTYTFTGSPGDQASEPVDANPVGALFSAITRGSGISPEAGANSFNSFGWTANDAIDPNDYYEFTITPDANVEMDLTNLRFTYRRSATGPNQLEIRSSLDGFGAAFAGVDDFSPLDNHRTGFGLFGFENITSAITFRIYGFGSTNPLGTLRLGISGTSALENNLEVSGQLDPIPEPATLLLFGAGLTALARRRRARG